MFLNSSGKYDVVTILSYDKSIIIDTVNIFLKAKLFHSVTKHLMRTSKVSSDLPSVPANSEQTPLKIGLLPQKGSPRPFFTGEFAFSFRECTVPLKVSNNSQFLAAWQVFFQ